MPARVPPVVLTIAGHDPSGGAGLSADIQTIRALGGHPASAVTALTLQDSVNAWHVEAVSSQLVVRQAEAVLADMPVAAIKLGLLATAAVGNAVAQVLRAHAHIPVVLDPVLAAGGGAPLAEEPLIAVYLQELMPHASVVTPNTAELKRLVPQQSQVAARASELLKHGAQHVLVKGADEDTPEVHNTLFSSNGTRQDFTWPRLPHRYHGSGCTLAAAIATLMAQGHSVPEAVGKAQAYTHQTLLHGWRLGKGQMIPNRRSAS